MIYKTGKVYRIICLPEPSIQYVGSTFNTLTNRWAVHRNMSSKTSLKPFLLKYGVKNFKIVLIKEYEVVDKKHLLSKEQLWINKIKCVNVKDAVRLNRVKYDIYHKKYRIINRDRINIENQKYRDQNKVALNEKKRIYYLKNRDDILNKIKNKYTTILKHMIFQCECSSKPMKQSYEKKHYLSKKHLDFINKIPKPTPTPKPKKPKKPKKIKEFKFPKQQKPRLRYYCVCSGKPISVSHKRKHELSKKHLDFMAT